VEIVEGYKKEEGVLVGPYWAEFVTNSTLLCNHHLAKYALSSQGSFWIVGSNHGLPDKGSSRVDVLYGPLIPHKKTIH
jgi:hypothetical protein